MSLLKRIVNHHLVLKFILFYHAVVNGVYNIIHPRIRLIKNQKNYHIIIRENNEYRSIYIPTFRQFFLQSSRYIYEGIHHDDSIEEIRMFPGVALTLTPDQLGLKAIRVIDTFTDEIRIIRQHGHISYE